MSHPQTDAFVATPVLAAGRPPAVAVRVPVADGNPSTQDCAFIGLQNAYRPHAGLMRLRGQAVGLPSRGSGPECEVSHLVDTGELFGFPWHDALWVPMFQLDLPGPTAATGPQRVVAELGRSFDGWALASWFVRPNAWLVGHRPIDCLTSRLPDVLQAARTDRFVATG